MRVDETPGRYGCWSDTEQRGKASHLVVQQGWTADGKRITYEHRSAWIKMACGHNFRVTDPACTGCVNRDKE